MIKKIAFWFINLSLLPWIIRNTIQKRKTTVIVYHDIKLSVLEKHIELLNKKYNFISLRDYIDYLYGNKNIIIPENAIIITFDDGFFQNYELLKAFKENKIVPTIFLCSGIVGTNKHYWWLHLKDPMLIKQIKWMDDEKRLKAMRKYKYDMDKEYTKRHALSIKEIKEMMDYIDFQSHTISHPILTKCDDKKSYDEIKKSKSELERKLSSDIYAIAYPNGTYGIREKEYAIKSGYKCALTLKVGFNGKNEDPFEIKRICIPDNAASYELMARVSCVWNGIKSLVDQTRSFLSH